jgi:hypothetical protein
VGLPIVMLLIVVSSALAFIYILYCAWRQARTRDLNLGDVIHDLYPVNWPLLEWLLDPAVDHELRWSLGPRGFRREQRRRMRLYRGLVRRMAHNASVLADYDCAIYGNWSPAPGLGSKLRIAVINVRFYTGGVKLRLHFWLLLPLATPNLSRLRKSSGFDGPTVYEELKAAAVEAFAQLKPDEREALTRSL